ncbi:efflux RND transporter periplasmic adaptor subunit [Acidobacteriota bacterium]
MKMKIVVFLVIGILVGAGAMYVILPKAGAADMASTEEGKQLYSCGMHPEVISDKPGNCPICGMKLTPIKGSVQAGEDSGKEKKILYWRAAMDPTEIYDKPGKSKMGMDLVPVYEGEEGSGAGSIKIDGAVQQNMNLRLADVERRDITKIVRAYGKVTFAQDKQYAVNTKIQGWIEKLYVNTTGERIRRGQALLAIYSPELVSTQEEYLLAIKNFEKLSSSPYDNIRQNAKKMLDMARNRLEFWDISEAEIEKIEETGKARRSIVLKSKISGVVTHKAVVEGDKVGPGMDLFHIADLSKVWIEASIYESDLPLIKVGQEAKLELDHVGGIPLVGKVDFIYPYLDKKSRSNNVRFIFNNPDQVLKPDMYATVNIQIPAAMDSLAIPSESIIHSGRRMIVFVTRGDGKFEPREVKTGTESDDGYVEIISGLFEEDKVVVSGQFLLDSESQTREAIAKMRSAQMEEQKTTEGPEAHVHEPGEEKPQTEDAETQVHEHGEEEHQHEGETVEKSKIDPEKLYACPMHPEFITTDPNAKCPICEMDLVKLSELDEKVDLDNVEFYTCPMHPEFLTTDKDGRCPECGMKLEKVKIGEKMIDPDKLYACPMHPEVITTDPNAKCPICEMDLVKLSELDEKVDLDNVEFYTCPMHPEFLTTDKDGRCPECGMKLEKVKK